MMRQVSVRFGGGGRKARRTSLCEPTQLSSDRLWFAPLDFPCSYTFSDGVCRGTNFGT